MEDHLGDRLPAAADRDRHLQRRARQVDVMVLIQGEPHDPAGADVEDTVQVQLALIGRDLGAVTEPHLVDRRRAELSSDQVRRPPPCPARPSGPPPPPRWPGPQATACGIWCWALWETMKPATLTGPSPRSPKGPPSA